MYDTVLVATDGTEASAVAVERGVALAREHGATLHALYVVDTSSSMGQFDPVVERAETAGEAAVESAAVEPTTDDATVENAETEEPDDRDDAHLQDVEPGAGCTEIWEHLSETRDE